MSTQARWNTYVKSGFYGDFHSQQELTAAYIDKLDLFDIQLPYWLRIGPINWEGKY